MEKDTMLFEKEKIAMRMHVTESHLSEFPTHLSVPLSEKLATWYGGTLDFVVSPETMIDRPLLYVNFVMSREGIFNLKDQPGGGPISQGSMADAFTMALLRSYADAVMVGASTLRSEPEHLWTSDFIFDVFAHMKGMEDVREEFRQWRQETKGTAKYPPVFFMTNSGEINPQAAAILHDRIDAYVVTNKKGADRATSLIGQNQNAKVLVFGDDLLDETAMLKSLREDFGIHALLHEGGRGAVSSLVRQGFIDQLFLTQMSSSPRGSVNGDNAQYLFEGEGHQPPRALQLVTVRKDDAGAARLYNFDARKLRSL
jgi:riboflavin biosynthesis pyrimidine reductase